MPDWKYCVERDGKTYCRDTEKRKVVEVEVVMRDVPLTPETMGIIGDVVSFTLEQRGK
jgi:hypothetical protein